MSDPRRAYAAYGIFPGGVIRMIGLDTIYAMSRVEAAKVAFQRCGDMSMAIVIVDKDSLRGGIYSARIEVQN